MKRIAIFCDGTWNQISGSRQTHVLRLSQAVAPTGADGHTQIVFYQQGVGTGRGSNTFAKFTDKALGGVFGWGLNENLAEAYRQLVFWYEPGDQIYIFGFSRGAYTARSLAGLIRRSGILPRSNLHLLPEAIKQYRRRDKKPTRSDHSFFLQKRHQLSPRVATSNYDLEWRREQGDTESERLRLAYMGIFDTVGALGLPGYAGLLAKVFNKKYQFHDTELSHFVRAARHAVAIDERRRHFKPTLWTNLDQLNGEVTGAERPYQQLWFAGNHGVVGGSGQAPLLARCSARWVIEGARAPGLGLDFDRDMLSRISDDEDPNEIVLEGFDQGGINRILKRIVMRDRTELKNYGDLSEAAIMRYRFDKKYRPGALNALRHMLDKPDDQENAQE